MLGNTLKFYKLKSVKKKIFFCLFRVKTNTLMRRFNTLCWSPIQVNSNASYGLLMAGKENGELDIYDPNAVMSLGQKEPLQRHSIFQGPVKGLDVSSVNPSLLGAGGPDGEVKTFYDYICIINNCINSLC
jgi:hypothetical protein